MYLKQTDCFLWFFLLVVIQFGACKQEKIDEIQDPEEGYKTIITHHAGDLMEGYAKHNIPTFFNVGRFNYQTEKEYKTIVLGESQAVGHKLKVFPFAILKFKKRDKSEAFILSVPVKDTLTIKPDYTHFMTHHYKLQKTLESWFTLHCQLDECSAFQWDNTYKTLLELK